MLRKRTDRLKNLCIVMMGHDRVPWKYWFDM